MKHGLGRRVSPMRSRNVMILCVIVICVGANAFAPNLRAFAASEALPPSTPGTGSASPPQELLTLADDFWKWRAATQPLGTDDIPRLDRPITPRDWSAAGIAKQRAALAEFDSRYQAIDASHWPISA